MINQAGGSPYLDRGLPSLIRLLPLSIHQQIMKRLTTKRAHYQFDPSQILYLTGNTNYCYVYMANDEVILACRTLKWFATKWPHFLRVHKTTLINPAYLAAFQPAPKASLTSFITMADQAQLKISRRRLTAVRHALAQLEAGP